jgi:PBP1b-binding outer membrane lipoprotein LpoB
MKKVILALAVVAFFAACNDSTEAKAPEAPKADSPAVKVDSPAVKVDSPAVKVDSPAVKKVDSPAVKK